MICKEPTMSRRRPHYGEKGRYGLPRSSVAVSGQNIRDIQDAFIRAVCRCSTDKDLIENAEQGENAALHRNHLFAINVDEIDLAAVHDALGEELEKLMGIYPNLYGSPPPVVPQRRATDRDPTIRLPGITQAMHDENVAEAFSASCLTTIPNERPYPYLPQVDQAMPMLVVQPPPEDPELEEGPTVRDVYNGWTEQEKMHGRMRALGIPIPRPSLWSRFKKWIVE